MPEPLFSPNPPLPAESSGLSRRELYRVVYPSAERPVIEVGRLVHEVIDVSERGLRYEVRDLHVPEIAELVTGLVQFKGSNAVHIRGEVIRTHAGLVILALEPPGIPFSNILLEQRQLFAKGLRVLD